MPTIGLMGTDAYGWIECRPWPDTRSTAGPWLAAVDLRLLNISRNYRAFACLFGVRNEHFAPIAAGRGMPRDASAEVRAAPDSYDHSTSWITYAEVEQIDWDEPLAAPNERITHYRHGPDGPVATGALGWTPDFGRLTGMTPSSLHRIEESWPDQDQWDAGDILYRYEPTPRRDVEGLDAWAPVWAAMKLLADLHGSQNVRLTVWFG